MINISKLTTGILLNRNGDLDAEIFIANAAIAATLGPILLALIDSGRALGEARRAGYEAGLDQGYRQCQMEQAMSRRIAERQEADLVETLLISGLVATA